MLKQVWLLSSCEAELLAGTAAVGDTIQMSHILRFLVNESALENSSRVTLTLKCKSCMAKKRFREIEAYRCTCAIVTTYVAETVHKTTKGNNLQPK